MVPPPFFYGPNCTSYYSTALLPGAVLVVLCTSTSKYWLAVLGLAVAYLLTSNLKYLLRSLFIALGARTVLYLVVPASATSQYSTVSCRSG